MKDGKERIDSICEWLKTKEFLKIHRIEKAIGVPNAVLRHTISGEQRFPPKHYSKIKKLEKILKDYGYEKI